MRITINKCAIENNEINSGCIPSLIKSGIVNFLNGPFIIKMYMLMDPTNARKRLPLSIF